MIERLIGYLPENNRLERIWKLAQVDFKRRYYNDRLGIVWALINPLVQIFVYYFVFSNIYETQEENFVLFIFCGLLIWLAFSEATKLGMNVFKNKRYLVMNIRFDRKDLFVSHVISVFMGLGFNFTIFIIAAIFCGVEFGINVFYFPILILNVFIICYAASMLLSTLFGLFNDLEHIWNLALVVGFFGSGIFYSGYKIIKIVPLVEVLNPILGIIINARNVLIYNTAPDFKILFYNISFGLILWIISHFIFKYYNHITIEKM